MADLMSTPMTARLHDSPSAKLPAVSGVSASERPGVAERQSGATSRNVACVLGVPIDIVSLSGIVERIANAANTRRPLFISTVNLNFLALSHRSPQFRHSLWASDLCTADGIAIVMVCRLLGIKVPERVAGSDFLSSIANSKGQGLSQPLNVFFFGGTEDAGPRACEAINAMNSPHLRCAGSLYPGFSGIEEMSTPEITATINHQPSDFLVVSLGAEKGQAWIMRNRHAIDAPIVSHLGATINFLAGSVRRAPRRVQAMGLEWLWRIREERHLATRYAQDGAFLVRLIVTAIMPLRCWLSWNRWRWRSEVLETDIRELERGHVMITLKGAATQKALGALGAALNSGLATASRITINLEGLKWADLFAMGTLLSACSAARERDVEISAINVSPNLRRGLEFGGFGSKLWGAR